MLGNFLGLDHKLKPENYLGETAGILWEKEALYYKEVGGTWAR